MIYLLSLGRGSGRGEPLTPASACHHCNSGHLNLNLNLKSNPAGRIPPDAFRLCPPFVSTGVELFIRETCREVKRSAWERPRIGSGAEAPALRVETLGCLFCILFCDITKEYGVERGRNPAPLFSNAGMFLRPVGANYSRHLSCLPLAFHRSGVIHSGDLPRSKKVGSRAGP